MFVIGVAGQCLMGKDTLADRLCAKLNERKYPCVFFWNRAAFAGGVKDVLSNTFDVDRDFIEEWKVKPEPPPGFDMTIRKALQFIGDGFRQIRGSIWVDLLFRDKKPKIVSDVRYVNEFRRVKQEGGLNILVGRTEKLNNDPNGSEAIIKPYVKWCLDTFSSHHTVVDMSKNVREGHCSIPYMTDFDLFVRNDGTLEDLYQAVDEQIVPFVEGFEFKGD